MSNYQEIDGVFRDWSGRPYRPTTTDEDGRPHSRKQETLAERKTRKREEAFERNNSREGMSLLATLGAMLGTPDNG